MLRKYYRLRLPLLLALPVVSFALIAGRLYHLQIVKAEYYREKAAKQQLGTVPILPKRGAILTSDGKPLAVSTPTYAVYSETKWIPQDLKNEVAQRLAIILDADAQAIRSGLKNRKVATVGRKATPRQRERIEELRRQLDLSRWSIYYVEEGKRHYPNGSLACHTVGFTVLEDYGDNEGLQGIEKAYNERLSGDIAKFESAQTVIHRKLEPVSEEVYHEAFGQTVVLTIDAGIQHAAETALAKRCEELDAKGGVAVVYEVKTGRLLGLASHPVFDPNRFGAFTPAERRNRIIADAIEPGSVMKAITYAILLDVGMITPDTLIDCEGGRAYVGGRRVTDSSRKMGVVDIREAFRYSSNVAVMKLIGELENARYYHYLQQFGFGTPTGIELDGEIDGQLNPLSKWSGLSNTSLVMGYEIRTTALQMVRALGAIANDGVMMQPYLVDKVLDVKGNEIWTAQPQRLRRVIGSRASAMALHLLEGVLHTSGGKKAAVPGYRIGGKTGTAHKFDPAQGRYPPGVYISSFCGVFPVTDPEVLIYIYIDEPQGEKWGSAVAGPIFKEIATDVIRLRKMQPDALPEDFGPPRGSFAHPNLMPNDGPVSILGGERLAPSVRREGRLSLRERRARQNGQEAEQTPDRLAYLMMPDLSGLSMREAMQKLAPFEPGQIDFEGTGLVVSQAPLAGEPLLKGDSVMVQFSDRLITIDEESLSSSGG